MRQPSSPPSTVIMTMVIKFVYFFILVLLLNQEQSHPNGKTSSVNVEALEATEGTTITSSLSSSSSSLLRQLGTNLTTIYFIGDLHADIGCATKWVEKTNLINLTTNEWIGKPEDAIVFLGDYVDKGSTSSSVLAFVRNLQESFPNNIVSILGNHDLFLILDTALSYDNINSESTNPHPLQFPFYDYSYAFMHPEEYLESQWVKRRDDDEEIYVALSNALQYVYDNQLEGSVHLCAPYCHTDKQMDIFSSSKLFNNDDDLRIRTKERLALWRKEYSHGLYDSGILEWMTKQPLTSIVGDALLVHGGISKHVINYMESMTKHIEQTHGIKQSITDTIHNLINVPFHKFFQENLNNTEGGGGGGPNTIINRLPAEGYAMDLILDIIQNRDYFNDEEGCNIVQHVIDKINKLSASTTTTTTATNNESSSSSLVNRIVVGHTPHNYAYEKCNSMLLASDSSLSRSFRQHGNLFCPISNERKELILSSNKNNNTYESCKEQQQEQSNGNNAIKCDGSISKITRTSPDEPWPTSVTIMTLFDYGENPSDEDNDDSVENDEF